MINDNPISDPDYITPLEVPSTIKRPKVINFGIPATARSHKYCIVCHRYANYRNRLFSLRLRSNHTSLCSVRDFCSSKQKVFIGISKSNDTISRTDIVDLVTNVRQMMLSVGSHLNFDIPTLLNEEDCMTLTGIRKTQFDNLATYLSPLRNTAVRSVITCLAVFLVKLRTGLSKNIISVLFSLKTPQIQRLVASVRDLLVSEFVPAHLGLSRINYDHFALNHTTTMTRKLFDTSDETATLVLDGTYIYIKKPRLQIPTSLLQYAQEQNFS